MRLRRMLSGVAIVAALVGSIASAAPVAATTPLAGETMYWKVDKAGVKGLIVVNAASATGLVVAWQLWGLRPNANYALGGFGEVCSAAAGSSFFIRDFTTNAKGLTWDPVEVAGSLAAIGSIRIRDLDEGSDLLCINSTSPAAGGPNPSIGAIKIKAAGVRGLAVIDESSTRRTVLAIAGLRAGIDHTLVIRSAGCAGGGTVLNTYRFTPTSRGRALVERIVFEPAAVPAGLGGELVAGSLRLKQGMSQVACAVPYNRAS